MRLSRFTLALAALVVATACTAEPHKIQVGDGTVTGDHFKAYVNRWEYSIKAPGKELQKIGIWTDELVALTQDGHAAFSRKQVASSYKHPESSTVTINVFDAHTLAPLKREWLDRNPENFTRLAFAPRYVTVERWASGPQTSPTEPPPQPLKTPAKLVLEAPVFDYQGGMWGTVLAGAPLKVGFEGTIRSLGEFDTTVEEKTFKVEREEMVAAGAGKVVKAFVIVEGSGFYPVFADS